jgi:hypothetical protein
LLLKRTGLSDLQALGPKIVETGLRKILTDDQLPSLDDLFPREKSEYHLVRVYKYLRLIIGLVGLSEAIETLLPKALDTSQRLGPEVRAAAVRLFSHLNGLRCSETCKWDQSTQKGLLKNSRHFFPLRPTMSNKDILTVDDERVVSRLADMVIKGDDVRHVALRCLKLGFAAEHREFLPDYFYISPIISLSSAPSTAINNQNIDRKGDSELVAGSRISGISCTSGRDDSYADQRRWYVGVRIIPLTTTDA